MAGNPPGKETQPIIIKKINKHHGHHGGSWKIAYADFVTAMMAFFLLMWLLASLNTAQKEGISEFFKQPLRISLLLGKKSGETPVNIKGGGADLHKKDGQVTANNQMVIRKKQVSQQDPANEMKQLEELKNTLTVSMNTDPGLSDLKNRMLMDVTSEGLRIQLIDNKNRPMFSLGSDEMDPDMVQALTKIAQLLEKMPNKVTIQGHTDAHPYENPDDILQSNWELSTQRANAARRALIKAGLQEDKIVRVSGYASTILLDKTNPLAPQNRRISIIVMKKNASNKILEQD
ncbi:flagellar motor protein MotB [Legionella dresdenensis]|uniref:Flagellar motor protein MotB n=1 Tax=Legionella dresdenensis TaxID=450200 RepID=A0ABV8CGW0_9GAMM